MRTGRIASSVLESCRSGVVGEELVLAVVEGDVELDVENSSDSVESVVGGNFCVYITVVSIVGGVVLSGVAVVTVFNTGAAVWPVSGDVTSKVLVSTLTGVTVTWLVISSGRIIVVLSASVVFIFDSLGGVPKVVVVVLSGSLGISV